MRGQRPAERPPAEGEQTDRAATANSTATSTRYAFWEWKPTRPDGEDAAEPELAVEEQVVHAVGERQRGQRQVEAAEAEHDDGQDRRPRRPAGATAATSPTIESPPAILPMKKAPSPAKVIWHNDTCPP